MHRNLTTGIVAILAVLSWTGNGHANSIVSIVEIRCLPELGIFTLRENIIRGRKAERAFDERADEIARSLGIYSIWALVDTEIDDSGRLTVTGTRTARVACDLGRDTVEVEFRPLVFELDLSIRLSAWFNGHLMIDKLAFASGVLPFVGGFHTLEYRENDSEFLLMGGSRFDTPRKQTVLQISKRYDFSEFLGYGRPPLSDFTTVLNEMKAASLVD